MTMKYRKTAAYRHWHKLYMRKWSKLHRSACTRYEKNWRKANPEKKRAQLRKSQSKQRAKWRAVTGLTQAQFVSHASRVHATMHHTKWTDVENSIIMDSNQPIEAMARQIGRTIAAVWTQRYKLKIANQGVEARRKVLG